MNKIFGIGLNKTGTSTLGKCLEILGYRHRSCSYGFLKQVVCEKRLDKLFKKIEQFDSFEDWPYPLVYKELDQAFPNSKFILTVRKNENTWLESLKKHSLSTPP